LHQASNGGHIDLTWFLVEHGADVSAKDEYGLTPLQCALSGDHMDLAWFLVKHGTDISAKDRVGDTPLHQASYSGHIDCMLVLPQFGSEPPFEPELFRTEPKVQFKVQRFC
jgi:ankyrin